VTVLADVGPAADLEGHSAPAGPECFLVGGPVIVRRRIVFRCLLTLGALDWIDLDEAIRWTADAASLLRTRLGRSAPTRPLFHPYAD
jgi:hypothetical protein